MHLRVNADLDIAKKDVKEKGFALSIIRNGETIFQSRRPGISALVEAIDKDRLVFKGASAADRILGRAAAMLFLHSEVVCIFASTASSDALVLLKRFKIPVESEKLVPTILNKNQTSTCPFEKLVLQVDTPEEAFEKLKACKVQDNHAYE